MTLRSPSERAFRKCSWAADGVEKDVPADRLGPDGVKGQVGVYGRRAEAEEEGEVVHLAGLGRFHQEAGLHPDAVAHQPLVHCRERQQDGNGHRAGVHPAVTEDEDAAALVEGLGCLARQPVHGRFERTRPSVGGVEEGQRVRLKHPLGLDGRESRHLLVGEDGSRQGEAVALLRRLIQGVAVRTGGGRQRHHQRLANRVDGGIGDLGEELVEVTEQTRRLVAEHRQGRVVAHGARRLVPGLRHGLKQEAHVLVGVAKGALKPVELLALEGLGRGHLRQLVEGEDVLVEPPTVGPAAGDVALELVVLDDAAFLGVHEKHTARLQTTLAPDAFRRDFQHPCFRGEDDFVVVRLHPPGRAEPISVERGADADAVGEGDGRRSVPGLQQGARVFVVGAPAVIHPRVAFPGLGNHQHHRLGKAAPAHGQQLEHAVELRRVARVLPDDGEKPVDAAEEFRGLKLASARGEPVPVAADGVDFTVVGDEPEGLCQLPGRKGVGGEARVHQGQRAHHVRVLEVSVEALKARWKQKPLVDDGLGRRG